MNVFKEIQTFNEVAGFLQERRPLDDETVVFQMSLIDEEYEELAKAFQENDETEVLDALSDLIVVAAGAMHRMGVNPQEAMEVVCTSNNSKFCYTEEEARKSVEAYREDERYLDVHSQYIGDRYVIFGRKGENEPFKILKGINSHKPNFNKLLK